MYRRPGTVEISCFPGALLRKTKILLSVYFPITVALAAYAFDTTGLLHFVHETLHRFIGHFQLVSDLGHCDALVCFNQRKNPVFYIVFLLDILLVTLSIWRFGLFNNSALQCGEADTQAIPVQLVHRQLRTQVTAGIADRLNAAAPAFDI